SVVRSDYGGVAGQALTFTGTLNRAAGASTLNLISNSDFVVGTNEVKFNTAIGTFVGATTPILPFATVTTFAGLATEAVDLVRDMDGVTGAPYSLGRVATYDAVSVTGGNVKATASTTIT